MEQVLWFLLGLGLGLALDFLLVKVMLRSVETRILALEVLQHKQEASLTWRKEKQNQ